MNKIVLITGATAGIGEASAGKFAANGWDLIITGRRQERLSLLAKSLSDKYDIKVLELCFDVQSKEAVQTAIGSLDERWTAIDVLLNNAGLALGSESFEDAELTDWDSMIDTNIKGLLYVTRQVTPLMIERGSGHVINLASIAGHTVYPKGHIYCATKSAVLSISQGMRLDLVSKNIKVSSVSPGAVETEFSMVRYKGDKDKVEEKYKGYQPLVAEDIAESIFWIANQPDHVNIEEIIIQPKAQASAYVFHRE